MPPPLASSQTLLATTLAVANWVLSPAPALRPSVIEPPDVTSDASPLVTTRFTGRSSPVSVTKTPYVPVPARKTGGLAIAKAVLLTWVSVTVRTPSGPPSALTSISRKSPGVPTPPRPSRAPAPLLPAVMVMLRASTSVGVGSVPRTPLSNSASTTAAGERSVTSAASGVAGHGGLALQIPLERIWPTRRSPVCSTTRIEPLVSRSMRPLLSRLLKTRPGRSASVQLASTSLETVKVTAVNVEPWWTSTLCPARRSLNV